MKLIRRLAVSIERKNKTIRIYNGDRWLETGERVTQCKMETREKQMPTS